MCVPGDDEDPITLTKRGSAMANSDHADPQNTLLRQMEEAKRDLRFLRARASVTILAATLILVYWLPNFDEKLSSVVYVLVSIPVVLNAYAWMGLLMEPLRRISMSIRLNVDDDLLTSDAMLYRRVEHLLRDVDRIRRSGDIIDMVIALQFIAMATAWIAISFAFRQGSM